VQQNKCEIDFEKCYSKEGCGSVVLSTASDPHASASKVM